jgi:hypothetical protein
MPFHHNIKHKTKKETLEKKFVVQGQNAASVVAKHCQCRYKILLTNCERNPMQVKTNFEIVNLSFFCKIPNIFYLQLF